MHEAETHPKYTEMLIGHEAAEAQFYHAWENMCLHHGWMICGPKGVGKSTLAWRMARFLLKFPTPHGERIPDCKNSLYVSSNDPIFTRIAAGGHADFRVVERLWDEDKKQFKQEITIDQIRKIIQFFNYSPAENGWRICLIDAADEMNLYAANALLKILEEPPKRSILILVAHSLGRIPITLRSRCIKLFIRPLNETQIQSLFTHKEDVDSHIVDLARGCPGRIRTILDEGKGGYDAFKIFEKMAHMLPKSFNRTPVFSCAKTLSTKNTSTDFAIFCSLILTWIAKKAREIPKHATPENIFPAVKWAETYMHIAHSISRANNYNLDRNQLLVNIFSMIEETAKICESHTG